MEGFFKKVWDITESFTRLLPVVRADDSEEEEIVDPQVILRAQCEKNNCCDLMQKLETCNARVRSKKKTAETCHEEMIDFINCVDHCVAKTLFTKLK